MSITRPFQRAARTQNVHRIHSLIRGQVDCGERQAPPATAALRRRAGASTANGTTVQRLRTTSDGGGYGSRSYFMRRYALPVVHQPKLTPCHRLGLLRRGVEHGAIDHARSQFAAMRNRIRYFIRAVDQLVCRRLLAPSPIHRSLLVSSLMMSRQPLVGAAVGKVRKRCARRHVVQPQHPPGALLSIWTATVEKHRHSGVRGRLLAFDHLDLLAQPSGPVPQRTHALKPLLPMRFVECPMRRRMRRLLRGIVTICRSISTVQLRPRSAIILHGERHALGLRAMCSGSFQTSHHPFASVGIANFGSV